MTEINREFAESEFDRMIDAMDIDAPDETASDEDKNSFKSTRGVIVKAIQRGKVTINDNGEPAVKLSGGDGGSLTFHEPTGAALKAMDGKGKNREVAQLYAAMGSMARTEPAVFVDMPQRDLKICKEIAVLFLAS